VQMTPRTNTIEIIHGQMLNNDFSFSPPENRLSIGICDLISGTRLERVIIYSETMIDVDVLGVILVKHRDHVVCILSYHNIINEMNTGRDKSSKRSDRGNRTDRNFVTVIVFNHRWISDLSHGYGGRRGNSCNRSKNHTDLHSSGSEPTG